MAGIYVRTLVYISALRSESLVNMDVTTLKYLNSSKITSAAAISILSAALLFSGCGGGGGGTSEVQALIDPPVVESTIPPADSGIQTNQPDAEAAKIVLKKRDTTPPTISSYSTVYSATSRSAKLTAVAADSGSGIKSVKASITAPTGSVLVYTLLYDSVSKTYTATYTDVPINWTFGAKTYRVVFTATDGSGNVSSASTSFTVNGLEAPPGPATLSLKLMQR